jgi:hypothetical protein
MSTVNRFRNVGQRWQNALDRCIPVLAGSALKLRPKAMI